MYDIRSDSHNHEVSIDLEYKLYQRAIDRFHGGEQFGIVVFAEIDDDDGVRSFYEEDVGVVRTGVHGLGSEVADSQTTHIDVIDLS